MEPACENGLEHSVAAARAESLRSALIHEQWRLKTWRLSWTGVFGAAVVGQIGLAQLAEEDQRPAFYVSAVKAALGAGHTPLFTARFSVPDKDRVADPCEDLAQLKLALAYAQKRQGRGVAWYQHFPGFGVNMAGVLYLGLVHDLWAESLVGAALGTAVGSLKLLTQPRRTLDWGGDPGTGDDQPWFSRLQLTISTSYAGISMPF